MNPPDPQPTCQRDLAALFVDDDPSLSADLATIEGHVRMLMTRCCDQSYACATSGELECGSHGGFDQCCGLDIRGRVSS